VDARITITVKALRACVGTAARRGVPAGALLGPIDVDPALLDDADAHVPIELVFRAWTAAPVLANDPAFGLHAAETMRAMGAHVLDYVAAHCERPRDLFEAIIRYQRLLMSRATIHLTVVGDVATLSHPAEAIPLARPPHLDDFVVAQWVLLLAARHRPGIPLRRVLFMHARPDDVSEYTRVFKAPLEFGAEHDAIEFDATYLDEPLEQPDPTLVVMLRRHGDALLASSAVAEATPSYSAQLRRHLLGLPSSSVANIPVAARALGTSERSLQRQLRLEGTTFKDVLDGVRHELSLRYLREGRHAIGEVAFLTGFTEVSAFSRAFRRWTGDSPAAWRRAQRLAPTANGLAPAGKTVQ
jgi:AraC-like DNA-binding protein